MTKELDETGYNYDGFCGTSYAARLLNISVGTVQNLVESNLLSAWKTQGGHRRISLKSIREYQLSNNIKLANSQVNSGKQQVIIIEDDKNTREMYHAYFDAWALPLDIVIYDSAINALLDLHLYQPLVLLTDLNMSMMSGFELIKTIRQHNSFGSLPIIAITGLSQERINDAGGLGKDVLILQKPIDMGWLKGFLQGLVSLNDNIKKIN